MVSQLLLYKEGGGSQPRQMPAQQVQGGLGGLPANPVPVHLTGVKGNHLALLAPGQAQVNQADGIAPVVRLRAGHAGGGQGDVTPQNGFGSPGHGLGHLGETAPYWSSSV